MLKNKVVVIIGGSGLLGKSIINYLYTNDAIVVNGDISEYNEHCDYLQCDLSNENSVENLIRTVLNKHGRIDGWINNAYPRTADWGTGVEEVAFASWEKNIQQHLNGYFLCCQKALNTMKMQKSGSLINMGSIYGILGPDFTVYEGTSVTNPVAYAAIKGGITNLTRYLASYYGKYSVRVNTISPGGIFDSQHPLFVKNYSKKTPLGRMGKVDEIAPSVAFLLSDAASYITGHNLVVDGGWSIV